MTVARTAQLVWYATGRFYKTATGDLLDVGYFLHLQGIEGALFTGARSESTALFTFASQPFRTSSVPNGGLNVGIDDRGTFGIYLRETAGATFDDPRSFAAGTCVATFARVSIVATAETTALFSNVFSAELVSSSPFIFAGAAYDFRELVGYGITQWGLAAAEPLTPPPPYQSVVPFVGSAIRVG